MGEHFEDTVSGTSYARGIRHLSLHWLAAACRIKEVWSAYLRARDKLQTTQGVALHERLRKIL